MTWLAALALTFGLTVHAAKNAPPESTTVPDGPPIGAPSVPDGPPVGAPSVPDGPPVGAPTNTTPTTPDVPPVGAPGGNTGPTTAPSTDLNTALSLGLKAQNDPGGFIRDMAKNQQAYDRVFGGGSFNHLQDYANACAKQNEGDSFFKTMPFFKSAGDLAGLEDSVKTGHASPTSPEYKQRDAAIKHELENCYRNIIPPKDAPPELTKSFHLAAEPVMNVVSPPDRHEQAAQQAAQQTNSPISYNNLGDVLARNGKYQNAGAAYNAALARDPANAGAYSGLAQVAYNQGDYPSAAKDAASALDLDPGNQAARATLLLSERRLPQGSWPELHNDLAKSAAGAGVGAMNAGILDDGSVAGGVSASGGFSASAALPAGSAAQEAARRAETFVSEARKDVQVGDARAAIGALQKAIAANPNDAEAYSLSAIAYSKLKDYAGMRDAAEKGLALAPNSRVLLNAKAFALNHLKDYKGALAAASRALELNPRDAIAHFNKAHALAGLGDRQGMAAELKEAASLDKKFEAAYNASIQLPQDSDLLLLFSDDKAGTAAPSLLELAMKQTEDPGWAGFALEAGVGALLMLAAAFAVKRLFGGGAAS